MCIELAVRKGGREVFAPAPSVGRDLITAADWNGYGSFGLVEQILTTIKELLVCINHVLLEYNSINNVNEKVNCRLSHLKIREFIKILCLFCENSYKIRSRRNLPIIAAVRHLVSSLI